MSTIEDFLRKAKELEDGEVWGIFIDGRQVKLPSVKSGRVSKGAAKNALRNALNAVGYAAKGDSYDNFTKRYVRFEKLARVEREGNAEPSQDEGSAE